ncbi:MAG: hypothetical protein ACYDA6_01440 [Solirubrobacteraceae bacterium]
MTWSAGRASIPTANAVSVPARPFGGAGHRKRTAGHLASSAPARGAGSPRARSLLGVLVSLLAAGLATPVGTPAAPLVHLSASLAPEHLGRGTTIGLFFRLTERRGRTPPPVRSIAIRYPNELGIALSGLGLETCTAAVLEASGPTGCPADSLMGRGTARAVVPFGPEMVHESATVTILRAEDQDGYIALLFDAQGISPVKANIVLSARLLPVGPPFGGMIDIAVPIIPSLPEAPPVSLTGLSATLGPQGLVYLRPGQGGGQVPYTPKGIVLPERCPRRGFPFASTFTFSGGTRSSARARVRCPASGRGRPRPHHRPPASHTLPVICAASPAYRASFSAPRQRASAATAPGIAAGARFA